MFAMTAAHKTLPHPELREGDQREERPVGGGARERPRPVPRRSHHRPLLRRGRAHRHRRAPAAGWWTSSASCPGAPTERAPAALPPPPVRRRASRRRGRRARSRARCGCSSAPSPALESAEGFRARVARELAWLLEPIDDRAARRALHRVRLGPYRNREEATAIADKVRRSLGFAPVLIQPLIRRMKHLASRTPGARRRFRHRPAGDPAPDRREGLRAGRRAERAHARRRGARTIASSPPRSPS